MPLRLPRPSTMFGLMAAATAWLCLVLPVFAQEAYYWTYAQHPALSYYDHPPMVAWLIWLGSAVFGDGAMGVRFGSWICGVGTTWSGWQLLRHFGVDERGQSLWSLCSIGSPILLMPHVLTNPDAPLVCFWMLTVLAIWRARDGGLGWWVLAGVSAGLALLSKYTAAFLAIGGLAMLVLDRPLRAQLRRPGPYLGVLLAAITFLPVVIWNVGNDFESFRFQTADRFARGHLSGRWPLELVSSQFGLLHPVLAVLLVGSSGWLLRRAWRDDARLRLLLAFGLPLPLYMLTQSMWIQIKLNWLAPAYVPLLLGVLVWWRESGIEVRRPRLLRWCIGSLVAIVAAVPLAPLVRIWPPGSGTSWMGWELLAARAEHWEEVVDDEDGLEGNMFFFAADYRDAAQLGRNLLLLSRETEPVDAHGQIEVLEPTLAQNVLGRNGLQFDHWEPPVGRIGQPAIFVLPRPEERENLVELARRRFATVAKVERVAIVEWGIHLQDADIYVCRGYRGPDPAK